MGQQRQASGAVTLAVFNDPIVMLAALCPVCALAALNPAAALSALSPSLALFNPAINPRAALLSFFSPPGTAAAYLDGHLAIRSAWLRLSPGAANGRAPAVIPW